MSTNRRKTSQPKAYVGHFSWAKDAGGCEPDNAKSTRLTCFAIAQEADDAVERFYELLKEHSKKRGVAPGVDIYLDDLSEVTIDSPMATLLFSATSFGPAIHGGVIAALGNRQVTHYEGQMSPGEPGPDGRPSSFTPQPFAVVASDGSLFRPS